MRFTRNRNRLGLWLATPAALALAGVLALPAQAAPRGHRSESGHHREYSGHRAVSHKAHHRPRSGVKVSYHDKDFGLSVRFGDRGHRRYVSHKPVYRTSHYPKRHHANGYWKQVWVPPVYAWHYRSCGTPYRVLVRHGYYKRVWVSYGYGTCAY